MSTLPLAHIEALGLAEYDQLDDDVKAEIEALRPTEWGPKD